MTLYEIDARINAFLENNVDPETGEVCNIEELKELTVERDVKLENIVVFIKNKRTESNAFKDEISSLRTRKAAVDMTADRLEELLKNALNGEKFSTPRVAVTFRKTQSIYAPDVWQLDEEYRRYKDPEPDKDKIKAALKAGEKVRGAELKNDISMTIK